MKAITYTQYGPPEVLHLKEVEKPEPGPGEILVKVHATTITSGDIRLRKAQPFLVRFITGLTKPKTNILGFDVSGEVVSTGKDVTLFKKGQEVFGSAGSKTSTYAEYICISENEVLATKPENLGHNEAAAVFFGGHTALHFLRRGNIKEGHKVLVYGASGSVGTYAVQLAKHYGAWVVGVCSTTNIELVRSLGAEKVIDYKKEDIEKQKDKYDIIFDAAGKSPFSWCVRSLKKEGSYLRAVHMSPGPILRGMWINIFSKKKVIGGVAKEQMDDLLFLRHLLVEGKLRPVVDKTYTLEKIVEAHAYVETGHKKGNVVVTIS
jgi:2-desacetyl-2-hydroxyethyl bacteriochlorophyllide A dehydrogenase